MRQTLRNKKAVFENLLKFCHENIENLITIFVLVKHQPQNFHLKAWKTIKNKKFERSIVTVDDSSNGSFLSQEVTSELNEKSSDGIANSNKEYSDKGQQEKIENQIRNVRK